MDTVIVACNKIHTLTGMTNAPKLSVLDLKQNKLEKIGKEIGALKDLKTLDLTNNDLTDLPTELCLLDKLVRIHLEGNPLKVIKHSVRTAGAQVSLTLIGNQKLLKTKNVGHAFIVQRSLGSLH